MALLWIDGFEGYGTTIDDTPLPVGILTSRYNTYKDGSSTTYEKIKAGRLSSYGLWLHLDYVETPALTSEDTVILGFAFRAEALGTYDLFSLHDSAITSGYDYAINIIGTELQLKSRGVTVATTSGLALTIDTWYWLEFKVKCHATLGTYELRIGEVDVLSDTGLDTRAYSTVTKYDVVRLGTQGSFNDYTFDDFYICDSSGSDNNDFLGNCYVNAIYPNSDGYYTDLTPLSGANYENVDEEVIDSDTTYVEGVTGEKDSYVYSTISGTEDILGIQVNTDCRETDAESFQLKTLIRSGSADYTNAGEVLGATSYVTKRYISETDPHTSVAWESTTINSAEFGLEVL